MCILGRVSHSAGLSDYRAALRTPGAGLPAVMSVLARMPIAMVGLSLLLYVQRQTGSFAIAGMVSAGTLVGVAVGSVIQGRIMDRLGPTRPLLITAGFFLVAVVAVVMAVQARLATPVMV